MLCIQQPTAFIISKRHIFLVLFAANCRQGALSGHSVGAGAGAANSYFSNQDQDYFLRAPGAECHSGLSCRNNKTEEVLSILYCVGDQKASDSIWRQQTDWVASIGEENKYIKSEERTLCYTEAKPLFFPQKLRSFPVFSILQYWAIGGGMIKEKNIFLYINMIRDKRLW